LELLSVSIPRRRDSFIEETGDFKLALALLSVVKMNKKRLLLFHCGSQKLQITPASCCWF